MLKNNNKNYDMKQIIFLQFILVIFSLSGVLSKIASSYPFMSCGFIVNYGLSLLIAFIYAIMWQMMLRKLELTTAFSCKAVTVIWGMVWGMIFFGEKIHLKNIIGALIIIFGIIMVVNSD